MFNQPNATLADLRDVLFATVGPGKLVYEVTAPHPPLTPPPEVLVRKRKAEISLDTIHKQVTIIMRGLIPLDVYMCPGLSSEGKSGNATMYVCVPGGRGEEEDIF